MSPRISPLVLLVLAAACAEREIPPPAASDARTGADDARTAGDDARATDEDAGLDASATDGDLADARAEDSGAADAGALGPAGTTLLSRLAGVWSGPAANTPLGTFPRMVMDFRAADARTLFGRTDLDADNSLRMAFSVETHGGTDVLVFRNGGLFMGLSRDTRTRLMESDEAAGTWRFCAIDGGCAYNEATVTMTAPDRLTLHVLVRGRPHLDWTATRQDTVTLPSPFPAPGSAGDATTPFPPMPTLAVTVRWSTALTAEGDAWIVLTPQDCSVGASCIVSRHLLATAPIGARSAVLQVDQVHAGAYKLQAFLDRDRNVGTTFAPDSGDGVAVPNQALTVAPTGTTEASSTIVFDLP
jgi:hypothetical protein